MEPLLLDKIKLYFTANMFRLVAVGALVGFIGVFLYAVQVDDNNPPPADMKFPVQQAVGVPSIQGGGADSLTTQTLSSREIAEHFSDVVAEALSFNKDNFAASSAKMNVYFTPGAYQQYRDFLAGSGLQETLVQKQLQSGAYLDGEPLEITHGVFQGVFKWVLEAPVTVSFAPYGTGTYTNNPNIQNVTRPQSKRFVLRLQFTRVANAANPNDVKIEIWQVTPARSGN